MLALGNLLQKLMSGSNFYSGDFAQVKKWVRSIGGALVLIALAAAAMAIHDLDRARKWAKVKTRFTHVRVALKTYYTFHGEFPKSLTELQADGSDPLLIEPVFDEVLDYFPPITNTPAGNPLLRVSFRGNRIVADDRFAIIERIEEFGASHK